MRLYAKIFIAVMIIFVVVFTVVSYVTMLAQTREAERSTVEENRLVGSFITKEIEVGLLESRWPFENLSKLSGQKNFLFWWIIKEDGTIHLADNTAFIDTDAYSYFPPSLKTVADDTVYVDRRNNYGIYIKKIETADEKWMFLKGFSLTDVARIRRNIVLLTVVLYIAATVFVSLVLFIIVRYFTRPIQNLVEGTGIIAHGNLEYRVPIRPGDEIGELASAFNTMTDDLKKSHDAVAEHGRLLETQMEERTKDLNVKISELEHTKEAMLNLLDDERKLEEVVKSERDRAQTIISSMGEGLCVVDKDLAVLMINPAGERLLKLASGQTVGKKWQEVIEVFAGDRKLPVEEWLVSKALNTCETMSASIEADYLYKRTDGIRFPAGINVTPIKRDGEVSGALILFRDITKEKMQQEIVERMVAERTKELVEKNAALVAAQNQISEGWLKLQQEKARLSASINSLSYGFILTELNENILVMNPAAQRILGLSKIPEKLETVEEAIRSIFDLHAKHTECIERKQSMKVTDLLYGSKYLQIFIAPILMAAYHEDIIGTVVLIEDVTEAKALQRSRDEFFSIASHELRTPLTAIRGNTSMILEYFSDEIKSPELKEMISDIHDSSQRLISIVADFLDTSRLELGKIEFKNQEFNIAELIQKTLKEFDVTGSQQKILLRYEGDNDVRVFADSDRVKQILINLVGNSLKFTRDGSIVVSAQKNDSVVEVAVTDTGRGIPLANQSLLFHKFQQAGSSLYTRDTTKGTGLGLYISRLMVEKMNGTIALVKSEEGKGSVFSFTLPVSSG